MTFDDPRPNDRDGLTELEPSLRDRILALDEPVPWDDWADVARRSRTSVSWGRRIATLAALAAALAVAGVSLGVVLWSGSDRSAQAPVWQDFSHLAVSPSAIGAPEAIVSQTRIVTQLGDGQHALYVSPTKQGGFCYEWTGGAGGCDQLQSTPFSATWVRGRLVGTVNSAYVSSVRIRFTDGSFATPHISWISAPINAGFFLYDIPAGKTVASVDGYDAGRPKSQITWFSV